VKNPENGRLVQFQERQIIVATVSKVRSAFINHGKIKSVKRNNGLKLT
jgi:hypothetical protein